MVSPRWLVLAACVAACNPTATQLARVAEQGEVPRAIQMYRAHARQRRAADPEALAAIARVVLLRAARSSEARERAAGFSAIRSLGASARELFDELAGAPGVVGDRATAALYDMDRRSGSAPTRLFAAAASDDPERRVAGLAGLEGADDTAGLVRALEDVSPDVRRAAAQRLSRRGHRAEATTALGEHARRDPDPGVRGASVVALGSHGEGAVGALEDALRDEEMTVRMLVPSSLAQASMPRAEALLVPMLAAERTPLALEAARALAGRRHPLAAGYILGALEDARPAVRAQAAVAAAALGEQHREALSAHIEDADVEVQLRVAGMLVYREEYRPRIIRALRPVSRRPDPFVAIRALAVLVDAGDAEAGATLRGALGSSDTAVRRLALLSWARYVSGTDRDVDPLVPLLEDSDRSVRLMAAAEIVRLAEPAS